MNEMIVEIDEIIQNDSLGKNNTNLLIANRIEIHVFWDSSDEDWIIVIVPIGTVLGHFKLDNRGFVTYFGHFSCGC